jgi:peptide-methionine (R)-S-oxide reductase
VEEAKMISLNQKEEEAANPTARRSFLIAAGAGVIGLVWAYIQKREPLHVEVRARDLPKTVTIVEFTDSGQRKSTGAVATIMKSEQEWRQRLTADSFEVTRHEGTERAYTDENPNGHAKGIFRCVCCETALFNVDMKFESGTGWPSFWEPIATENVLETTDDSLGMIRVAVSCRRCDAHLGHVFPDGPAPTGLRYCMNSVAMRFVKAS